MTFYGLNPSFHNWTGRQILFADPLRRGRSFEVYDAQGQPTGKFSELGPDGWPKVNGQRHGVRLFGSMDALIPVGSPDPTLWITSPNARLYGRGITQRPGGPASRREWNVDPSLIGNSMISLVWDGGPVSVQPMWAEPDPRLQGYHLPGILAMRRFSPLVIRSLDWQRTNDRRDWTKPRVQAADILQGNELAIEHQCKLANMTGSSLWWCAPPRFDATPEQWVAQIEEYLIVIRDTCRRPVVLELGNEAWNQGFALHNWLEQLDPAKRWYESWAQEIALFWSVVERVLGPSQPIAQRYYTFVGGFIGDPELTGKILSRLPHLPHLAGPAFYVGAAKSTAKVQVPAEIDSEAWERAGTCPSQAQLVASTRVRLAQTRDLLVRHRELLDPRVMLTVYEAGQSFIAGYHPWRGAALEFQATRECGDLYRGIRAVLEEQRVVLANWYSLMTDQDPAKPLDVFGLSAGHGSPDLPKLLAALGG